MLQLKNNNNTIQFLWINYSLVVKIGSVTAEIFLIWTNVTRTKVAWTNVTMTVEICSRWSQEPAFKVWSKSSQ